MIEILVNEYWMYSGEPFHLCRYNRNGVKYLIGYDIHESYGIEKARELKGYHKPEGYVMEKMMKFINKEKLRQRESNGT